MQVRDGEDRDPCEGEGLGERTTLHPLPRQSRGDHPPSVLASCHIQSDLPETAHMQTAGGERACGISLWRRNDVATRSFGTRSGSQRGVCICM